MMAMVSSHTSTLLPPRPSLFSLPRSSFSSSAKALGRRELRITQRPHSAFTYATVYKSFFQLKQFSSYMGELAIYPGSGTSSKARMLVVPAHHSYPDSSIGKHKFDGPWTRIEGENGQGHRQLNLPTSHKVGFNSDMRSNASGSPPRSQATSSIKAWNEASIELKRMKDEVLMSLRHSASEKNTSLNLTSQKPSQLYSFYGKISQATCPTISGKSNFQGVVSTVDGVLVSHSKQTKLAVEDMSCMAVQQNEPIQETSLKVGEKIESEQTGGGSVHSNEKSVINGKSVGKGKIGQLAPRRPSKQTKLAVEDMSCTVVQQNEPLQEISLKIGEKIDSEQTGGGSVHSIEKSVINGKSVGKRKIGQQAPRSRSKQKKLAVEDMSCIVVQQNKPLQEISSKVGETIDSEQTGGGSFHSNEKGVINGKAVGEGKIGQQAPLQPADSSDYVIVKDVNQDPIKSLSRIYDDVLVVNTVSAAKEVVQMLTDQFRHHVHACDTEVAKIDVKQETPVDHGEIICFSIYSGPEADFGNGKSSVWVDVLDGGGRDILLEFAPFFEDPSIKKVWHNYSFDNHVLENYGFKLSGFHADTMHMARLWDSSRQMQGGYSLEALSGDSKVMSGVKLCSSEKELIGKISMKTIFGTKKLRKDGSEGKVVTMAPVEELQRNKYKLWVSYSALDAISTLKLYESLKSKLSNMPWLFNDTKVHGKTMFDFYEEYWRPFGEILVKMETEGMLVDRGYLAELEKVAKREQEVAVNRFRNWASKYCSDAMYMNVGSDIQLRQLFFGGIQNRKNCDESLPHEKIFKVPNFDNVIEEGKKVSGKLRSIKLHQIGVNLTTEIFTASGWPSCSGDALKALAGKVSAVYDFKDVDDDLLLDDAETAVTENVDTSAYGTAFAAFVDSGYSEEDGREACHAIAALCEVCSIDSLISNFILPLQGSNVSGKDERVHCSLNINTETGRLSARRPNLQNQPALEKDRYKIRQAFIAAPGNSLVVADYGQLELRILAHLANCKSMLDAFKAGGDFHSRTAMNMYPHIREAVEKKQVLLEWDPQPGEDKPPVPLLKDAFASERRKAKMLNFSIAYGKTPVGLARDWKVSVQEAEETVNLWYKERQEVLAWQKKRKAEAIQFGFVRTLLGRSRRFPTTSSRAHRNHIERAAINTPVQGSAADVAMCAMIEISENPRLKELGWKLILQVHDEVILEGPVESAEIAKDIVVDCMSKPFKGKNILKVDLNVDAKCAGNWYAAK